MHIHLDPIGGVAGDMFAAALLDAFPDLVEPLMADFKASGLGQIVDVARLPHTDGILTGSRFQVEQAQADEGHRHRHIQEIRTLINRTGLDASIVKRAMDIFELLAVAESRVHGTSVESVSFHEVGAWDSIADVVAAAWLIERVGTATWSCAALPMGRGRTTHGAHGYLPVPAPAAAALLEGLPVAQKDHIEGERITPTGAAIIRHLAPSFDNLTRPLVLRKSGNGFGTARFPGISNVLRVLVFEPAEANETDRDQIAECRFEVDDQTPEDLAAGLDILRAHDGVLDVSQGMVLGKKGRSAAQVQVLARLTQLEAIVAACFRETTTLGVRWSVMERAILGREMVETDVDGTTVRVKRATRPGGVTTAKPEMDDIAALGGVRGSGHAGREAVRRLSTDSVGDK